VSATTPALLLAAAGVGFGHAVLPDHWVPLAVVGRARRYPASRVARLAGLAGVAHVLVSIVLGAVIIAIGLHFRDQVKSAEDTIVGGILLLTAVGFAVAELTGRGHHHHHHDDHAHEHHPDQSQAHDHDHEAADTHEHEHEHSHDHDVPAGGGLSGIAAVMVPFGAAASPDLTILPVFLAAAAAGTTAAIGTVVVFAGITIATIVTLTLVAFLGGLRIRGEWLERWGNLVTAAVLAVIGALVLIGVI
jgi:nickel/cobalt transporter (NicO) family protein